MSSLARGAFGGLSCGTPLLVGPEGVWVELASGADAEFRERLVEVVAHRPRAEKQMSGDVAVGQALGSQPGDLQLLRRQPVKARPVSGRCPNAGSGELSPGLLRPRRGADPVHAVHGRA